MRAWRGLSAWQAGSKASLHIVCVPLMRTVITTISTDVAGPAGALQEELLSRRGLYCHIVVVIVVVIHILRLFRGGCGWFALL